LSSAHEKWGQKQKCSVYNFVQCTYLCICVVFDLDSTTAAVVLCQWAGKGANFFAESSFKDSGCSQGWCQ